MLENTLHEHIVGLPIQTEVVSKTQIQEEILQESLQYEQSCPHVEESRLRD